LDACLFFSRVLSFFYILKVSLLEIEYLIDEQDIFFAPVLGNIELCDAFPLFSPGLVLFA